MIEEFAAFVPSRFRSISGSVFYSRNDAFSKPSNIYFLGKNPGGEPSDPNELTIGQHLDFTSRKNRWSEYIDGIWKGKLPGTMGIQPSICSFFNDMQWDIRSIPASNFLFPRSPQTAMLNLQEHGLTRSDVENICWKIHAAVVDRLKVRVIIFIGDSNYAKKICSRLGGGVEAMAFQDESHTQRKHRLYTTMSNVHLIQLCHPSFPYRPATWKPAGVVRQMLARIGVSE